MRRCAWGWTSDDGNSKGWATASKPGRRAGMNAPRTGARRAEQIILRLGLSYEHVLGVPGIRQADLGDRGDGRLVGAGTRRGAAAVQEPRHQRARRQWGRLRLPAARRGRQDLGAGDDGAGVHRVRPRQDDVATGPDRRRTEALRRLQGRDRRDVRGSSARCPTRAWPPGKRYMRRRAST